MNCVPPPPSRYRPRVWVLLALLLVVHTASPIAPVEAIVIPHEEGRATSVRILGPTRPLRIAAADTTTTAVDAFEPVVSARSVMLRNNITISQSRLVLSRLDQLFLLQRLLDLVDLAPKLAPKMVEANDGISAAENALVDDDAATATGFLFDMDVLKTKKLDPDTAVAIVDVAGTMLGFGWRYPLAYWTQLGARQKPKCALGVVAGRFFYC